MLLYYSRSGALPLGKIGSRLQVHPTSVTNTIDGLERLGLVSRTAHDRDRRMTLAAITRARPRDRPRGDGDAQRRPLRDRAAEPTTSSSALFGTLRRIRIDEGDFPRHEALHARRGACTAGLVVLDAQPLVLLVQAALAAPADFAGPGVDAVLARFERGGDRRLVAVVVRGLDEQPPRVRRAGLGDRALFAVLAGGVLARHDADVRSDAAWVRETAQLADLGAEPERGDRVDPAQTAQPCDRHRPRALRALQHDLLIERGTALLKQRDRGQVVLKHDLRDAVIHLQRAQPAPVHGPPRRSRPREPHLASRKELRKTVPGPHQISARRLTRPREIAELLLSDRRHAHEPKLPRGQQPHQPLGIAPISLDPITTPRHRPRRAHPHLNPATLRTRTRKPIPNRTRLIRRQHRPRQPLQKRDRLTRTPRQPPTRQLTTPKIQRRRQRPARMHIQPHQRPILGRLTAACGGSSGRRMCRPPA